MADRAEQDLRELAAPAVADYQKGGIVRLRQQNRSRVSTLDDPRDGTRINSDHRQRVCLDLRAHGFEVLPWQYRRATAQS